VPTFCFGVDAYAQDCIGHMRAENDSMLLGLPSALRDAHRLHAYCGLGGGDASEPHTRERRCCTAAQTLLATTAFERFTYGFEARLHRAEDSLMAACVYNFNSLDELEC
jgi:hypothetical protein